MLQLKVNVDKRGATMLLVLLKYKVGSIVLIFQVPAGAMTPKWKPLHPAGTGKK